MDRLASQRNLHVDQEYPWISLDHVPTEEICAASFAADMEGVEHESLKESSLRELDLFLFCLLIMRLSTKRNTP